MILISLFVIWYAAVRLTSPFNQIALIESDSVPLPRVAPEDRRTLRIGTWNIAHGRGLAEGNWTGESQETRAQRIRDIAQSLLEAELDIVILNEVDFDCNWSHRVNQAQEIAESAGFTWRVEQRNYDAAVPFFSIRFGNAVLSRFPIVDARAVDFPAPTWWHSIILGEKDGCICTIELPGGSRIAVGAIHLEAAWDAEEIRNDSARAIVAGASESDTRFIAAGDFNTSPPGFRRLPARHAEETAVSIILDSLALNTVPLSDPQPYDYTFPADAPDRVIDWVMVPCEWTIISKEVVDSTLSDHRPVIMEVERDSD